MNSYYNGFQRFPQLLRKYKYFPQRLPRLLNGAAPPCPAKQAPPCGAPRVPVPLGPCPLRRAAPPCPTGQARNPQGGLEGFPQRFQGTKKKGRQSFVVMFLRPRQHFTTISLRLGTYAAGKQPPLIALAPSRGGAKKKRHPLNGQGKRARSVAS